DLFELVRHLVEAHAPDYAPLLRDGEPGLAERVASTFARHLDGRPEVQRWGWKLPETANAMPVVARLFPEARVIHLVRDGRDVAFSPFVAPKARFWRKIYFGDDRIRSWRGLAMTQRAYRRHGHLFNAARWVNSVTLGRSYGAPLAERYLEMSYEALVADPGAELARVAAFLGLAAASNDLPPVSAASIGKWRRQPAAHLAEIRPILEPTLGAFGYAWGV
ncbi:MAG TPA: sulfotransferase, partial [Caulobacteraceae bacterium]|nr:sulfotransferase [Caulobacteraceae bacterium]